MGEIMIDFSKAAEELNSYKGSEKKKTLILILLMPLLVVVAL